MKPAVSSTAHAAWQAYWKRYEAWLAALPLSEADRQLVGIVDRVRDRLLGGAGIPAKTAEALHSWSRKERREGKKWIVRSGVDFLHSKNGLPLTEAGAFAKAGELFADPKLSESQVRKIYYYGKRFYYGKRLPRKKKTRPLP
jgi:hypothetical protein